MTGIFVEEILGRKDRSSDCSIVDAKHCSSVALSSVFLRALGGDTSVLPNRQQ